MPAPIDPTPETSASPGYALLIGIDHYDNLDPSAELPGSRNDVLMWYRFCRNHLGIPAENIRVLTSPPLDPSEDFGDDTVPPETLGDAAEASIRDGYAWLLAKMDGGKSPGLLTYSGHGMVVDGRPALSTASLGGNGAGAILLSDLRDAVSRAKAEQALTAIFDCCHVVAPAAQSHLRRSTALVAAGQTAPEIVDEAFNVSHRVLLAARPGQAAYQCNLGERFHGALSFALVTTAEQWKATNAPRQTGLDVDYRDLFKRARKLLRALRMKQSPKLRVPFDPESRRLVRRLPFFGTEARATSRKPDALRVKAQMPPDWFFTISMVSADGTSQVLAQVLTMGRTQLAVISQGSQTTVSPVGGSGEQWFVNLAALAGLRSAASLLITSQQPRTDANGALVVSLDGSTTFAFGGKNVPGIGANKFGVSTYRADELATWSQGHATVFSDSINFSATINTNNPRMSVQLVVSDDGKALVAAQWYLSYDSTPLPPPAFIQPGGSPTTIGGISTGITYFSGALPAPSVLVYSAVSMLTPQ